MHKMKVKLCVVTIVITQDEILCEDENTKQFLTPFLETGFTDGAHQEYILRLVDACGENVELISVEEENHNVVY